MSESIIFLYVSGILNLEMREWRLRLVTPCGRVQFDPTWESGNEWWRTLRNFDLWYVLSGNGTMELDTRTVRLTAGSCIWMRPGHRYITRHDPDSPLAVYFFHFELLDEMGARAGSDFVPPAEDLRVYHFSFVEHMMQRILALRDETYGEESSNRLFSALLAEIVRVSLHSPSSGTLSERRHVERINQAVADMHANTTNMLSVAELARNHGYSVSHFSRVFASIVGKRPQQYLMDTRLDRAREMLSLTHASVGQVANSCGFSDIYHFSRMFKKRTGVSPKEYRQILESD